LGSVRELRVALTVAEFEAALAFYRDALGLDQLAEWDPGGGRGVLLDAGRATLELLDEQQAGTVDALEVGERVAGRVRLALQVAESGSTAETLTAAGADLLGGPTETPWGDVNVRLRAPDGMQLTLFTVAES
jgi:lactoylglutathione lyase